MTAATQSLFAARGMLAEWTTRTIRARYQQSVLGGLWAIAQPAASVAILTVIFTRFVPVQTAEVPYALFSCAAVIPWTLLSSSLTDMSTSLVQNMNLVTKIYFAREVLPLAALLARLFDFAIAMLLMAILLVHYDRPLFAAAWAWLPAVLAVQLSLLAGVGFAAAALNVFARDVQPLLTLTLQVWFYASPVIYPAALVAAPWRPVYFFNPMAGILESYRDILLHGRAPGAYLITAAVVSLALLAGGYSLFKRLEQRFADVI